MIALSIGPLALPFGPLALLAALLLAHQTARRVARGPRAAPSPALPDLAGGAVLNACFIGLAAGRLAFLALHAQAYMAQPWAMLDVRDGGWQPGVAVFAMAAWLGWRMRAHPALRRPLAAAVLAGGTLWLGASYWAQWRQPAQLPDLVLSSPVDGREVLLSRLSQGRPRVVNLWASWCGPCRQELPLMAAMQQRVNDVDFLFVDQGESAEAVQRFLQGQGLKLRNVWLDPGAALGPALGSRGLPTTLFLDADGRLVDSHMGVLNSAALAAKIEGIRTPSLQR